ncbi:MAG: DUF374 domain-containing protein [Desulfobulbaceae bacterium]|nr:DUF374 domain-containing protein [Desulfobulbaceae bacterium]
MADFLYKASLVIVPRLYVGLSNLWFSTCRAQIEGEEYKRQVFARGAVIAIFWHYSFFYMFYHLRKFPSAIMVSASKDGEYIARVAELLGHETVRGSSSRQGVRALKGLIGHMRAGKNAGIVADGSQGPARKLQGGCLVLASKSGFPILPMTWSAGRYKAFKSWDRTVLPLPFSTIYMEYGEPFYVPANLKADQLEKYRVELEERMNELYRHVWQKAGKECHDAETGTKER